ncbi:hypothetical protein IEQ34_012940 [Dendrobium chrysotoxum]|uniref:Pentatricopeptide repeat-containing protein n=1 Tax=Dendrobium chrysotoxum TaxID=161865 RepID=A0AAV7GQ36_DENCH|nr:hypothetical protein IEQ34_012940 [Dendrobium chrysotoxum]
MDCRRRSAVDDDRSRRIRLAVDDNRYRGRWTVDDDRSRIAFYQAQVNESLDRIDNNLRSIDKNLRSIRRMRMSSATIPTSSSSLLSAASRDRKQFRDQPALDDYYPPLELPLRWRNPPPFQHSNRAPPLSQTTATPPKSSTIRPARTGQSHPKGSSEPPSSPIVTEATNSASSRDQTCNPDSASSRDQTTAHELPASHTPNSFSNSLHDFSPFDSATDTLHDRSPLPVRSDDPKPTPASIRTALPLPLRFRDSLPDKANAAAIFETQSQSLLDEFEEAVDGGVHILALGALDNSFPVSDSGILVVRNFNNGVHGKGVSVKISGHGNNYSTSLKALLMRGETNMLLMSQRNSAKPHASRVDQLDIETGKFVTEWKFEKDGIDITRRDITNDSMSSIFKMLCSQWMTIEQMGRWLAILFHRIKCPVAHVSSERTAPAAKRGLYRTCPASDPVSSRIRTHSTAILSRPVLVTQLWIQNEHKSVKMEMEREREQKLEVLKGQKGKMKTWIQAMKVMVRILHEMVSNGCFPNIFTCNIFLPSLWKEGRTALGEFGNEFLGLVGDRNCNNKYFADLITYSILPNGLCKARFELDEFVKTSLVSIYAKCGGLNEAERMFDKMPKTNVMSWTAMISGCISKGKLKEFAAMFQKSLERELKPESLTLVRMLTTCTQLGDAKMGKWVHEFVAEENMDINMFVAASLVDEYTNCGRRDRACCPFDGMVLNDVVVVIDGCSSNKLSKKALKLFFKMEAMNMKLGHLDDIEALIKFIIVQEVGVIWKSFLSACRIFDPGGLIMISTTTSLLLTCLDGVEIF